MPSKPKVAPQPSSGILGTLLSPLQIPGRVLHDVETIVRAVVAVQEAAERHLASLDARAGVLVEQVAELQVTVTTIDGKVERLMGLEETIEKRMETLRDDLNTRMLAVEAEVHGIRPSIDRMGRDVQDVVRLLPDPSDGPLARLRDTLTSS
jgi:chromosome segregation ATPase